MKRTLFFMTAAISLSWAADLTVRFTSTTNYGIKQIRVNGSNLLFGCGFGFIGSLSGADNNENITTCRDNNGGVMKPFSGAPAPFLPHGLSFTLDHQDPTKLHFEGSIGQSSFDFATVSMPMDARREVFTHFRYQGGGSAAQYMSCPFAYPHENGPVYICGTPGTPMWGEIVSQEYTVRVTLTGSSRPMKLFFVNHPQVRNVEFSFGKVRTGDRATVRGYLQVLKTDPSAFGGSPQPSGGWRFEAESQLAHQIGRIDGDGWSVNVNDPAGRYMAYGPYTTAIPAGDHTASFRLMLDNVSADNLRILTLDVYDANSGRTLAVEHINRKTFKNAFTYQEFVLPFKSPPGSRLEFRVLYRGASYTKLDRVAVR